MNLTNKLRSLGFAATLSAVMIYNSGCTTPSSYTSNSSGNSDQSNDRPVTFTEFMDNASSWFLTGGGAAKVAANKAAEKGNYEGSRNLETLSSIQQANQQRQNEIDAAKAGRSQVNIHVNNDPQNYQTRQDKLVEDIPVGYIRFATEGKNYIRDPKTFKAYEKSLSTGNWELIQGYRVLKDDEFGIIQFRVIGKDDTEKDLNGDGIINTITEMRSCEIYSLSENPVKIKVIFQDPKKNTRLALKFKSFKTGDLDQAFMDVGKGKRFTWERRPENIGDYQVYIEDPENKRFIGGIDFKITP